MGPTIVLGTKSFPGGLVLGQLYKQTLEARGFKVRFKQGFESTEAIDSALVRGTINMYPEYTDVMVQGVFQRPRSERTAKAAYAIAKRLQLRRGFALLERTRFSDKGAIAILKTTAAKHDVDTLSDLGKIPNLRLGALPGFQERSTGLAELQRRYDLAKPRLVSLEGSPYAALDEERIDAAAIFSTDPPSGRSAKHTFLKDPARVLGPQNAAPVVARDLVTALGTRFTATVNSVSAKVTQDAMATMTKAVVVDKRSPKTVVRAFLVATGIISTANLFVAPNGNDDGARCRLFRTPVPNPDVSGRTLCASFNRAYQLARPGDTVEIETGSYPGQTLLQKRTAAAPNVVFKPAIDGSVTIEDLTTRGDHVRLENMTVATGANHLRGWASTGSNVTLAGVRITGPYARVDLGGDSRNVTWRDGSLGTPGNTTNRVCGLDGGPSGDPEPVEIGLVSNLLFSNLDFYPFIPDLGNPACGTDGVMHLETIRVNNGVQSFRLERSRFHRGDGSNTARLFVTRLGGANSDNLQVVNNWFGAADGRGGGTQSVLIGSNQSCIDYVFAHNHFEQGLNPGCIPMIGLKLVGNTGVGPPYLCIGTSRISNLWTWSSAGSCGTDRWVIDANFSLAALRYAPDGYHLRPNSPAINAGETAECMTLTGGVDIDGQRRSGRCDAGPDEFKAP